ncbi:ATP-binding protein [Bacillus sp. DNRA2]|nr:ATP-binding protein [Bacillus sp. DNRA2]
MRSFSEILGHKGISLQREIVAVVQCQSCGRELKTYRMQLIGGSKKGEWTTLTEECSCYFSKEVLSDAQRKKLTYFRERSTINQSLILATLENYCPSNHSQIHAAKMAIEFIETLAQNKPARLLYYGSTGLGKSHLAVAISKIVEAKLNKTCLFIDVPRLKQLIKASWLKDSDFTELEMMRSMAEVDILILDDVGAEGITPWTKELMFSILNSRLSKPLLVTTNMDLEELYQEYGPKITDRIIDGMAKQQIINIKGQHSYRLLKVTGTTRSLSNFRGDS